MVDAGVEALLQRGLKALDLKLEVVPLLTWVDLLLQWNQAKNLTAIRCSKQIVIKHLLDSLAIHPWIEGDRVLDVGSGAGLPGIPLALLFPQKHFVLCDSNLKKIAFLRHVVHQLQLNNVVLVHQRVEQYASTQFFDRIVSRAFADLAAMISLTGHLLAEDGQWLAMKGNVTEPAETLLQGYHCQVHPIHVPLLTATRHLICVSTT